MSAAHAAYNIVRERNIERADDGTVLSVLSFHYFSRADFDAEARRINVATLDDTEWATARYMKETTALHVVDYFVHRRPAGHRFHGKVSSATVPVDPLSVVTGPDGHLRALVECGATNNSCQALCIAVGIRASDYNPVPLATALRYGVAASLLKIATDVSTVDGTQLALIGAAQRAAAIGMSQDNEGLNGYFGAIGLTLHMCIATESGMPVWTRVGPDDASDSDICIWHTGANHYCLAVRITPHNTLVVPQNAFLAWTTPELIADITRRALANVQQTLLTLHGNPAASRINSIVDNIRGGLLPITLDAPAHCIRPRNHSNTNRELDGTSDEDPIVLPTRRSRHSALASPIAQTELFNSLTPPTSQTTAPWPGLTTTPPHRCRRIPRHNHSKQDRLHDDDDTTTSYSTTSTNHASSDDIGLDSPIRSPRYNASTGMTPSTRSTTRHHSASSVTANATRRGCCPFPACRSRTTFVDGVTLATHIRNGHQRKDDPMTTPAFIASLGFATCPELSGGGAPCRVFQQPKHKQRRHPGACDFTPLHPAAPATTHRSQQQEHAYCRLSALTRSLAQALRTDLDGDLDSDDAPINSEPAKTTSENTTTGDAIPAPDLMTTATMAWRKSTSDILQRYNATCSESADGAFSDNAVTMIREFLSMANKSPEALLLAARYTKSRMDIGKASTEETTKMAIDALDADSSSTSLSDRMARCVVMLHQMNASKGIRALQATKVLDPCDPQISAHLQALYPRAYQPRQNIGGPTDTTSGLADFPPRDVLDTMKSTGKFLTAEDLYSKIQTSDIASWLSSRKSGVAGGPSGWTYDTLKECLRNNLDHITPLIRNLATGRVPPNIRDELLNARGIALAKPVPSAPEDGKPVRGDALRDFDFIAGRAATITTSTNNGTPKPRPIGILEAVVRLANGVATRIMTPMLSTAIGGNEYSFHVRSGIDIIIHGIRAKCQKHPEWITMKIDIRNAFNCASREQLLHIARRIGGAIEVLIQYLYGAPTSVSYKSTTSDKSLVIIAEEGTMQGEPIAGAAFNIVMSAAIAPVLLRYSKLDVSLDRFADDGYIGGPAEVVFAAFDMLVITLSQIAGLTVNYGKTSVYAPGGITPFLTKATSDRDMNPATIEGIMVAGSPVGSPAFEARYAMTVATSIASLTNDLIHASRVLTAAALTRRSATHSTLQNPVQTVTLVLRWCIPSIMTYLLRTTPPAATLPAAARVDETVIYALEILLNPLYLRGSPFPLMLTGNARTLVFLAGSGLGFQSAVETAALAYIASVIDSATGITNIAGDLMLPNSSTVMPPSAGATPPALTSSQAIPDTTYVRGVDDAIRMLTETLGDAAVQLNNLNAAAVVLPTVRKAQLFAAAATAREKAKKRGSTIDAMPNAANTAVRTAERSTKRRKTRQSRDEPAADRAGRATVSQMTSTDATMDAAADISADSRADAAAVDAEPSAQSTQGGTQTILNRATQFARRDTLLKVILASCTLTPDNEVLDATAALRSNSGGNPWLMGSPAGIMNGMDDYEYRTAAMLRLHIRFYAPRPCPLCHKPDNGYGHHAFICEVVKGSRTRAHTMVLRALVHAINRNLSMDDPPKHTHCEANASMYFHLKLNRPKNHPRIDLVVHGQQEASDYAKTGPKDKRSKFVLPLYIDVVISSPCAPTYIDEAAKLDGFAMKKAEAAKYKEAADNLITEESHVVPASFETLGRFTNRLDEFLKWVALRGNHYKNEKGHTVPSPLYASAVSSIKTTISVALQRSNALIMCIFDAACRDPEAWMAARAARAEFRAAKAAAKAATTAATICSSATRRATVQPNFLHDASDHE